ncbi:MAG: hypothetical protein JO269_07360 [Burkholderiaceae bacterium]|nr:hypothetical protein [Burkholderiaceae bacterium]
MPNEKQYWFPAKRYGWGWGLPQTWQDWAVLGAFLGLVAVGRFIVQPELGPRSLFFYMLLIGAALIAVIWLKGEPPRWRWGEK